MEAPAVMKEDPLDVQLRADKGMIDQGPGRDCRHNSRTKCSHCLPLDPFDPAYLAEKEIKHMSFHAYLKKITGSAVGRSSVLSYPLENPVCRVKECKNHAPYPAAICSKCQPDPVILARQEYRHVDNVAFENEVVVDKFLDFWRKSGGAQRVGILLGRYEPHPDVPLGIKATVSAIFEPPQVSTVDKVAVEGLYYDADKREGGEGAWLKEVEELGEGLGIRPVGWIFTDLVQLDEGKFHYSRNPLMSYLVSAQECITASFLQNRYPNICKLAREGFFGSKFVTVCVSGDASGHMEFRGYQTSNQAGALVRDAWLVPTAAQPDKAYVRDDEKCVPEVKFTEKDAYGNNVSRDARPFPVEYLLVDVPAGLASAPIHSFNPLTDKPRFPITNREQIAETQSMGELGKHMEAFGEAEAIAAFTDFHLLHYLRYNPTCQIPKDNLAGLLSGIKSGSASEVAAWMSSCPEWATIQELAKEEKAGGSGGAVGGGGGGEWACKHCTFANPDSATDCQICGLPK